MLPKTEGLVNTGYDAAGNKIAPERELHRYHATISGVADLEGFKLFALNDAEALRHAADMVTLFQGSSPSYQGMKLVKVEPDPLPKESAS